MSLVREADRLCELARRSPDDLTSLSQAADYVVGFNMKGLHKVESELFFPWVRKKVKESTVSKAFETVMDRLELEQRKMHQLGVSLVRLLAIASRLSLVSIETLNSSVMFSADTRFGGGFCVQDK